MLIAPTKNLVQKHIDTRNGLEAHFNRDLEKILNDNSHRDTYWVLGKINTVRRRNKLIVRPFLQACLQKPGVVRESFVYEIDNKRGTKTLLWVMHPGDLLSFPTLGKSIRVAGDKGVTILTPK